MVDRTRTMQVGDRLKARPCVVTITTVDGSQARGNCDVCATSHILDRAGFEAGNGPWVPCDPTAPAEPHMAEPAQAQVAVTGYMVSRLPDTSINQETWGIRVEAAGHGRWAVRHLGQCLGHDETWSRELSPSSRDDEWLERHRWDDVTEAINAASRAEPHIVVNGLTPEDVRQREIARESQETSRG